MVDPDFGMEGDQTLFGGKSAPRPSRSDHVHSLVVVGGPDRGKFFEVSKTPMVVGRHVSAGIVLSDRRVSSRHCRVWLDDHDVVIEDMSSTNGTWLDGHRLEQPERAPIGAVLQVGECLLRHEFRSREDLKTTVELDGELKSAARYVEALLPPPRRKGFPRVEWSWHPCATLGGDAFGYGELEDGSFAFYLIDVCGHGASSALHSVSVINTLRRRTLSADFSRPGNVLSALNRAFPMESHGDMYFTIWYGVYRHAERRLRFASGGHPPALLVAESGTEELRTHNMPIGMMESIPFEEAEAEIHPGSRLYVCSDGCFEVHTSEDELLGYRDFRAIVLDSDEPEPKSIFDRVKARSRFDVFEDDFSLLLLDFQ
ncbi:MAG: SpoIIE family protein phosphatase [Planctomycetota bacterium]